MKHFLIRVLIFISAPLAAIIILALLFPGRLPAPKVSDRYSFNEKVFHFDNYDADYLCLGSSIALNNFDSDVVIDKLSNSNYFNFSSWGVRPIDSYTLLKIYLDNYRPKSIFFISNVIDFYPPVLSFNEERIKTRINYPYSFLKPFHYLSHLDIKYYFNHFKTTQYYKSTDTIIESLKFDKYGGVKLDESKTTSGKCKYWNDTLEFRNIDESNYKSLEKILVLLGSKNINFIFIQTPVREGLVDDEYNKKIRIHNDRVREIVNKYDQLYINGTERIWPDTMFFDYGHFNERGARAFTNYCLNIFKAHYNSEYTENNRLINASALQETNLSN